MSHVVCNGSTIVLLGAKRGLRFFAHILQTLLKFVHQPLLKGGRAHSESNTLT